MKILTVNQCKKFYPNEWVLLKHPVVAKDLRVLSGEVVCHDKDRDIVDQCGLQLRLRHAAIFYTGVVMHDIAINL